MAVRSRAAAQKAKSEREVYYRAIYVTVHTFTGACTGLRHEPDSIRRYQVNPVYHLDLSPTKTSQSSVIIRILYGAGWMLRMPLARHSAAS